MGYSRGYSGYQSCSQMSAESGPLSSEDIDSILTTFDNTVKEMTDKLKAALDRIKRESIR